MYIHASIYPTYIHTYTPTHTHRYFVGPETILTRKENAEWVNLYRGDPEVEMGEVLCCFQVIHQVYIYVYVHRSIHPSIHLLIYIHIHIHIHIYTRRQKRSCAHRPSRLYQTCRLSVRLRRASRLRSPPSR